MCYWTFLVTLTYWLTDWLIYSPTYLYLPTYSVWLAHCAGRWRWRSWVTRRSVRSSCAPAAHTAAATRSRWRCPSTTTRPASPTTCSSGSTMDTSGWTYVLATAPRPAAPRPAAPRPAAPRPVAPRPAAPRPAASALLIAEADHPRFDWLRNWVVSYSFSAVKS